MCEVFQTNGEMKLFHRTSAKNAVNILKQGFRDTTGSYMMNSVVTGVWVSKRDLDSYEVKEKGKPYRE